MLFLPLDDAVFRSLTFVLSHKIFKFFVAFHRFFLSSFLYSPSVVKHIVLFSLFFSTSVFVLIAILIRFFNSLFPANKFTRYLLFVFFDFVSSFLFVWLLFNFRLTSMFLFSQKIRIQNLCHLTLEIDDLIFVHNKFTRK